MTKVDVLYFAQVRENSGKSHESYEADDLTTVKLLALVAKRNPGLRAIMKRVQISVNREVVHSNVRLKSSDEIALLMPVMGG